MAEIARITGRTPDGMVEVTLAQPFTAPEGGTVSKLTLTEDQLSQLDIVDTSIVGKAESLPADIVVSPKAEPKTAGVSQSALDDLAKLNEELDLTALAYESTDELKTSAWERFSYGYDKGTTDVENGGLWLESRYPLGNLVQNEAGGVTWASPEELYGSDFMSKTPEDRRKLLLNQRRQQIAAENAAVINANEEGTLAQTAGEFVGMLSSPTTLIPAFKIFKSNLLNLAGFGALFGAEYETLHQLAEKGEINPREVGKTAAISAVATPILAKSVEKVARLIPTPGAKSGKQLQEANTKVDQINQSLAKAKVQGLNDADTMALVRQETGLAEGDILKVAQVAEKPITPPVNADEAKLIVEAQDIINDPISARVKYPWWDKALSNISYDLQRESAPIALKLRDYDRVVHEETYKYLQRLTPFFEDLGKLPEKVRSQVSIMLRNGEFDEARSLAQQYSQFTFRGADEVTNVLKDLYKRMKGAGYNVGKVENYYPSKVKDVQGLRQALTGKQLGLIENAVAKRAKQLGVDPANVPQDDVITITNAIISGRTNANFSGTTFSFTRGRTLDRITEKEAEFYADPIEAMHDYVRQTVAGINKRKFFGVAAKNKGATDIDLDASIGGFINKELKAGTINQKQADKIADILRIRFNQGEQLPAGFIQIMRNAGYLGTLADVVSATKQLADVGVSGYMNGLRHTLASMFGRQELDMRDFGLLDVVAAEYGTAEKMASTLTKWFQRSGFTRIDRFGKDVFMNAALRRGRAMAQSLKGQQKLRKELEPVFGKETTALINDLKAGNVNENVKLYVWNQLSEAQPIALSEMPYAALAVPDARIFYQMKTFSIKQLVNMRRLARQKFDRGDYIGGLRDATGLAVVLGLSGATVDEVIDLMLNQNVSPEDIPDGAIENLLGLIGMSKYVRDTGASRGPAEAAIKNLTPPILGLVDSAVRDVATLADPEGDFEQSGIRSLRSFPIVGQLLYNYFGGGLERAQEQEFQTKFDR